MRICVATLLLISGLAHSQSITLVSGNDYLPFADQNAPDGGLATHIVKKAFAEVKIDTKIEWHPWARGYNETKAGMFVATFPYSKNAEREGEMIYSDTMIKLQDRVFTKANAKKYNFADLASLSGSTICVPVGWQQPPKLVDMIKSGQIKMQSPKDMSTCVKMVEAERVDFFITEESSGLATVAVSGVAPGSVVLAAVPPFSENSLHLIAAKSVATSKDLILKFNKGLDALRKNGGYDKIMKANSAK